MTKKLIFILLMLLFLSPLKIKADYMDSYVDWTLDRTIFAHQLRNGEDHITNLAMITTNGVTSYCIEPGITADKGSYYTSTINIDDTTLKNVDTKRLSLIGYYGYGYVDHNQKEYYMAAQELIWRQMGVSEVWWTDAKYDGNILNIDYYKDEILRLVNDYEKSPLFNFKDKYLVGDELVVEDSNNLLKDYELSNYYDNVSISDNNIKIKVKPNNNTFSLRRKKNDKLTKFYYKEGYQTIGSFEYPYDYEANYKINATYGKIILEKKDLFNGDDKPFVKIASLKGACYGLYNSKDELIMKKETDEDGKIIFDNLEKGEYFIKEITPSTGYVLDKNIQKVELNSDSFEKKVESFEKIITNKIVITKVLDDEKNKICSYEESIVFYVYDEDGNYVTQGVTDVNGNITLELPYGNYVLKQITSLQGIDKVSDRLISVTEDGIVQNITLVNHRIKENILPKTGKSYLLNLISLLIIFVTLYINEKKIA